MVHSPQSLIIVGGGIVGLCVAVAAQARGHTVTVVVRDDAGDTASGVAAGMIAPALEALGEIEPEVVFARLRQAQSAWHALFDVWPQDVRDSLDRARQTQSRYVWPQSNNSSDLTTPRLKAMGVAFEALTDAEEAGIAADCDGVMVSGDGLVDAAFTLQVLTEAFLGNGGTWLRETVRSVGATSARLSGGEVVTADHVVVAAGYGARDLAASVPSLSHLAPIKGHVLDLPTGAGAGPRITRSPWGYLAEYGGHAKFGASMQFGRDDLAIESEVVADLKSRAAAMLPGLDLSHAVPRVGIRASTPDGWPLIGRDATGVWVAVGMRRNGYVFAPYAAQTILAMIGGGAAPAGAEAYNPNRF
jgi:glycine oxidase